MKPHIANSRTSAGFTLIELLIAVIIIAILVAIIVPLYVSRANDARLAAARTDLESIKTAEEHAAIDTGYFYRLYVLNDVRYGDSISNDQPNDVVDGVRDEVNHSSAGQPTLLFIDSKEGTLIATGATIYNRLVKDETSFNWNGPYVNYTQKTRSPDPLSRTTDEPLDPWGNTFLLFTKEGYLDDTQGRFVTTTTFDGKSYDCKIFDRPTILTMGPNGSPGDGSGITGTGQFGQGDDLIRQF